MSTKMPKKTSEKMSERLTDTDVPEAWVIDTIYVYAAFVGSVEVSLHRLRLQKVAKLVVVRATDEDVDFIAVEHYGSERESVSYAKTSHREGILLILYKAWSCARSIVVDARIVSVSIVSVNVSIGLRRGILLNVFYCVCFV